MAVWTLIPDKLDDIEDKPPRFGAFLTTTIAFFFVEMGDKTQLATTALGAHVPMACTYCAPVIPAVPRVDCGHDLKVWSAAPPYLPAHVILVENAGPTAESKAVTETLARTSTRLNSSHQCAS